jgi:hypothetical protein
MRIDQPAAAFEGNDSRTILRWQNFVFGQSKLSRAEEIPSSDDFVAWKVGR